MVPATRTDPDLVHDRAVGEVTIGVAAAAAVVLLLWVRVDWLLQLGRCLWTETNRVTEEEEAVDTVPMTMTVVEGEASEAKA